MMAVFWADPMQSGLLVVLWASAGIYAARYMLAEISLPRSVLKTLPVIAMAGISLSAGGPILLTVALVLCALGDYFMSLDDNWFVAGLSAFLAGHIVYIALFFGLIRFELDGLALFSIGAALLYSTVFATVLWRRTGKYRTAVMFYIAVITVMAMFGLLMPSGLWLVTLGALVFVISDTALAIRMFVLSADDPRRKNLWHTVWWTYIFGQFAILIGVVGA